MVGNKAPDLPLDKIPKRAGKQGEVGWELDNKPDKSKPPPTNQMADKVGNLVSTLLLRFNNRTPCQVCFHFVVLPFFLKI